MPPAGTTRRIAPVPSSLLLGTVGLVFVLAFPMVGPTPSIATPGTMPSTVVANVTVDGRSVVGAVSPTQALPVQFDHPLRIMVRWSSQGGKLGTPSAVVVGSMRTTFVYLGQPIAGQQTDVGNPVPATTGTINGTLDTGSDRFVVEGLYEVETTLWATNGTRLASAEYYLRAAAPYHLTVVNVGLVTLGAYVVVDFLLGVQPPSPRPVPGTSASRSRRAHLVRSGADGAIAGLGSIVLGQQLGILDLSEVNPGGILLVATSILLAGVLVGAGVIGNRRRPSRKSTADPDGTSSPGVPTDPVDDLG